MIILTELKKVGKPETKAGAKRTPYSRNSTTEHREKMLSTWIEVHNQCHVPVSMLLVQTRLMRIYQWVIIMLNHVVQIQVGLEGSQRDIILTALK
jgi:hypothetical protein